MADDTELKIPVIAHVLEDTLKEQGYIMLTIGQVHQLVDDYIIPYGLAEQVLIRLEQRYMRGKKEPESEA